MTSSSILYKTRVKRDSKGREYKHIYIDTKGGGAWLPLDKIELNEAILPYLMDECNTDEWKLAYLNELYKEYRLLENQRRNSSNKAIDDSETGYDTLFIHKPKDPLSAAIFNEILETVFKTLKEKNNFDLWLYVLLNWCMGYSHTDVARIVCEPNDDIARCSDKIRKSLQRLSKLVIKNYEKACPLCPVSKTYK